jgi:putative SOS response-associated peptidase YedK
MHVADRIGFMCGRYALYGPRSRKRAEIEYFSMIDQFPDSWNVASTDVRPITRLKNGVVEQVAARWGLIPNWAKDEKIGFKCINARAETVATLPAFRGAYKLRRRCLVPACGFFEWETRPDGKQPFYFTNPEGALLAFAGLWDKWRKPDGSEVLSYTIITTAPNDFVARFRDRMPVVLAEPHYGRWLEGGGNPQGLLRACHNETLYNYPVSRQVNSVRNNDASLVVPLEPDLPIFSASENRQSG